MMNKALLKDLFKMIIKFIFWNIVAFVIPLAFILYIFRDAGNDGTGIIMIFFLPLFFPSLFYLIYSSYKLFNSIMTKTKSISNISKVFNAVLAILVSTFQILAFSGADAAL